MEIRRLEDADDVRAVARVNASAWRAAYDGVVDDEVLAGLDFEPPSEQIAERLDAWRGEPGVFLVAESDGTVVGYADFRWGEQTKAFVGDDDAGLKAIYVHPERWGEGVGTALLERGLDELPDDIRWLRLETLAENEAAKRFYEARGFERTGAAEAKIGNESYPTTVYTLER
ncbi:GNAT family N-acetyltransferase [Natronomonas salina]|uniref:GNAT family N-acetyltransferase n=1 Tax=Natronomonas salina TaxID=1710540 RepID=UPI0015B5E2A3|nr:GNAT family N-acetyltransferase [Natronomonas salina]QLD88567.1 GNAT family N-acetyltransferase [Natronomonas salina]